MRSLLLFFLGVPIIILIALFLPLNNGLIVVPYRRPAIDIGRRIEPDRAAEVFAIATAQGPMNECILHRCLANVAGFARHLHRSVP